MNIKLICRGSDFNRIIAQKLLVKKFSLRLILALLIDFLEMDFIFVRFGMCN